jgi:hypothetical protein
METAGKSKILEDDVGVGMSNWNALMPHVDSQLQQTGPFEAAVTRPTDIPYCVPSSSTSTPLAPHATDSGVKAARMHTQARCIYPCGRPFQANIGKRW